MSDTHHQQQQQPDALALEVLDELYKFVDGLDPDFIIRERISIIKSRIQDPRYAPAKATIRKQGREQHGNNNY